MTCSGRSSALRTAVMAALMLLLTSAEGGRRRHGDDPKREGRFLPIFQIVRFENEACDAGVDRSGTCYTAAECDDRGGVNGGTCAQGFGVCCTFTLHCGESSSENCTYFEGDGVTAGGCQANICPCGDNVCQMRLDFVNLVITGPSTSSTEAVDLLQGVIPFSAATAFSESGQCLTDTFSVITASGARPPIICGINSGEHMYVDAGKNNCNTLSFTFGRQGVGTGAGNRAFNIKVTQYSCNFVNLAPQGCTQYFYGRTSDSVQSYNYNNGLGQHLASQDQSICVRRERGNCRICWYAVNVIDFALSGFANSDVGIANGNQCCDYVSAAIRGFDCVHVPGAVDEANGDLVPSNICGRNLGLVTGMDVGNVDNTKSVCSTLTPFVLNFRSDAFEVAMEETSEFGVDRGFRLGYTMDAINC